MSYEQHMKHHRNIRKCRRQSHQYMGFDTGSGHWPSPRKHPYLGRLIEVREWFAGRHFGDKQYNRECIREAVADCRAMKPKQSQPAMA